MQSTTSLTTLLEIQQALQHIPALSGLSSNVLDGLARDARATTYPPQTIIFTQGDPSRDLYLIVEGKIIIFKTASSGGETSINLFGAGDIIGEFAALDGLPRSATARTVRRSLLLKLSGEALQRRMVEFPTLALAMAKLVVQKARWTADYAEAMAQYDATGRLLHLLLLLNKRFGQVVEPERHYVLDLALSQSDLASLIGARREWVNRLLRRWQREGVLRYQAGKIVIRDLPQIAARRNERLGVER